jgi:hypothetical protein
MAFTTQTKIWINDAHVISCLSDTLHLSGSTLFGTNAAYSTGMTNNYNKNTITDVDYVTGQTANKLNTSIFNGYTGATQTMYNDVGDPTGFIDNENIVVTYSTTARTITLTHAGGIVYYWRGKKYTLASPWTSTAHTNDTQAWYLYSNDGTTFAWSTAVWDFDNVHVAARPANTTWAIREVHGTMPWEVHEELHRTIGTYRVSGFGLTPGTFVLQPVSPTDANNTPGFDAGNIADEDLQTSLSAWSEGSYTQLYFTSTGTVNLAAAQSNLFRVGASYPKINPWNGTAFTETEMLHNEYANWYVIRIPVAADSGSQLYRAVVLQPQFKYGSLEAAQAESPLTINLGNFTNLAAEFVLIERITLHTDSGYTSTNDVRIEAWSVLTGAKFNQTSTTPGAGSVTAGNVSVTPLSPFTQTNLQTLSDAYATCFNTLSSGSISSANNGLTKLGTNVVLGGGLTGNTVIGSGTCLLGINANAINLTGATIKINGSSAVCLVTAPGAGAVDDLILVRDTTGVIQTLSVSTVTGNTYSKACINAYTGATDIRLDTIEADYITGATEGLTKVGVHDVCLGGNLTQTGSGVIGDTRTDTVGLRYGGIYRGEFVCDSLVDAAYVTGMTSALSGRVATIEADYVTGGTNGITKTSPTSHEVKLGGALTEPTSIAGAFPFTLKSTTLNLSGSTCIGINSPDVMLVATPPTGSAADSILTRCSTGEVAIVPFSTVTGNTYSKAQINSYTGATDIRLDTIEADYVTGATGCIVKYDAHNVCLAAASQAVLNTALTGTTGTHLGTSGGRNVCLDTTAICIIDNGITGVTNGLTKVGSHCAKLGGIITEPTLITGAQEFSINVNEINLTGASSGVSIGGAGLYIPATIPGSGGLLCIGAGGRVCQTSLSAFGGITGGTNGITDCFGSQNLGLGGALIEDTQICGAGFDLNLGTPASKLDVFAVNAAGASTICGGTLGIFESGATFTDLRAGTGRTGIQYASDYSTSFVPSSLVTKCYVDTVAAGLHPHDVVKVATTTNIDLNGAETIDGIAVTTGDRVLVKNQTTGSTNGIYVVNTAGAWTRATDFDGTPTGEVVNGDLVPVFTGATQANTIWVLTTSDPITVGTSSLDFTLFSRLLGIVAGDGIDVTPNGSNQTVSVDLMTNGGLAICTTELAVADTIAGIGLSWSAGVINANVCSGGTSGIPVRYNVGDTCLVVNKADISTALGGVITGATNGLTESPEGTVILGGSISTVTNLSIAATGGLTITDAHLAGARTGIVYANDYSDDYVARSLVDADYVTGLTSGLDVRLDTIEADYVTGATGGIYKTDCHTVSLTALNEAILAGALTGSTNGLTDDGRIVKLGGILSEDTTISGGTDYDLLLGVTASRIDNFEVRSCTGTIDSASGLLIYGSGTTLYVDCNGLCITDTCSQRGAVYDSDYSDNYVALSLITCQDLCEATSGITGAITTANNGLTKLGQNVVLGGTLTGETTIITSGGSFNLCTPLGGLNYSTFSHGDGTSIKYFDGNPGTCLDVNSGGITMQTKDDNISMFAGDDICLSANNSLDIYLTAGIITDGNGTPSGLTYAADYSATFVDNSLITKKYVTSQISGITGNAITGATNGLCKVGQDAELGGLLTKYTAISLGAFDLQVTGTCTCFCLMPTEATLKSCTTYLCGKDTGFILSDATYGAVFVDSRTGTTAHGLEYYDDYSTNYTCLSLVNVGYVTGLTSGIQADITQICNDIDYISGITAANTADISALGAISGFTLQSITGVTNGLTKVGAHSAKLGGTQLSETTVIPGNSQIFSLTGLTDLNLGGTTVDITGIVTLQSTPATGSVTTDAVLVWNSSDKQIKQIPATSLGEDNNDYSMTVVTGNTTLTTGSTYAILANSPTVARTITLPATPFDGQAFKFKDAGGQALTYNITISGNGNNIDGDPTAVINTDYGALELLFNTALDKWLVMSFVN